MFIEVHPLNSGLDRVILNVNTIACIQEDADDIVIIYFTDNESPLCVTESWEQMKELLGTYFIQKNKQLLS